ncbi:uncharacterized protein LOC111400410 [Olea europaea var. sylvestris]|uniref:uncharacterized protein LOC111400410 n=1 Tax=Olea europaea var. sylvestris TaxID=158386 RepID=UPI000C1D5E80|nr:uncharacterized protein LOC111400410 [Olea europaea var. sylvestris]
MLENIHLAQELLRQYNRKRVASRCLFKIDLKKVYDSVNWEFLKNMLHDFGFPMNFIGWVMECISTPSYFITLNGSLHGFFKGKKGLRQASSIISGPLKITHLAFADDLMLFGLRMNISKSSLYTAGVHGQELEKIF